MTARCSGSIPCRRRTSTILAVLQAVSFGGTWTTFAVLEHAQAFPKMGVSSAFNYGRGYGAIQMALAAAGIPFDIVVPRKWQAALGCLTRGDKNVSKRRAEQLFPGTEDHACDRRRTADRGVLSAGEVTAWRRRKANRTGSRSKRGSIKSAAESVTRPKGDRNELEATAAGAPGDGADPERPARSSVRGDRRRARSDEYGARARAVGDR
jgi:hypothetical protein